VEEFFNGSQDRYPPVFRTKDALSSVTSSLAPGVDSPPLLESTGSAFIPELPEFSGSPASNSPVANTDPYSQWREDRQAWIPAISQVETNRYRDNAVVEGTIQSSCQLSHRPRRKSRSHPIPGPYFGTRQGTRPIASLSRPSQVYASTNYSSSPPLQAAPQLQSRAPNAEKRPKNYWCSELGCGMGFTQPQVLSRHVKDMHEEKESCSHCLSFTFSRGRPYIYRKHLAREHPKIVPLEVQQKDSRCAKESSNMGTRQAQSVRPLTLSHLVHSVTVYP
jgi:hypothetical protein